MKRNTEELLTFIFDSIGEIAKLNDNQKLLQALAKMGRDIVFADRCTIWILDREEHVLWTKVAHGIEYLTMEPYSGIVGYTIKNGESLIINDVYADERFNKSIDIKTGYVTENMMVIPMKNRQGKTTGAIQVMNKKGHTPFTQEDLNHLKLASTYVSETICSMLLLEEIDATQKELIHIMSIVGERRSKETGNHVKRVAAYTKLLAELYGMDKEEAYILGEASPMHDIGKIAIPDAILNKPARLNLEEWEIMKTHTQLGYEMLKNSPRRLLKTAAIVAYEHHERYDGKGYPRNLKGEDIHIYGRIVALVDVFDALNSKRVYKDAWKKEDVFKHLVEEKGKHFDPNLVEILLQNKEQFLQIDKQYKDEFSE
ncbi:MAG TPA: HD domain-containing protein [Epsilonproteobacteria bacterium]|nr:HD domain-containing protein [Campylobacterota bacterium]